MDKADCKSSYLVTTFLIETNITPEMYIHTTKQVNTNEMKSCHHTPPLIQIQIPIPFLTHYPIESSLFFTPILSTPIIRTTYPLLFIQEISIPFPFSFRSSSSIPLLKSDTEFHHHHSHFIQDHKPHARAQVILYPPIHIYSREICFAWHLIRHSFSYHES